MRRVDAAGEEPARLQHLVARVVHGGRRVIAAANERELVGDPRVPGEDFAQANLWGGRRNLPEGTADFGGRLGLHIEDVELTGGSQIEDHDDGAFIRIFGDRARRLEGRVIHQRQADGAKRAGLQKIPAR